MKSSLIAEFLTKYNNLALTSGEWSHFCNFQLVTIFFYSKNPIFAKNTKKYFESLVLSIESLIGESGREKQFRSRISLARGNSSLKLLSLK